MPRVDTHRVCSGRLPGMPSRRRPKSTPPAVTTSSSATTSGRDPAELFAAAVKESDSIDRARREKEQQQREAAERRAAEAKASADALNAARRDLDRAIEAVRDAKREGRSTVEADATWKAAKARVIELETGERPSWAKGSDGVVTDASVVEVETAADDSAAADE